MDSSALPLVRVPSEDILDVGDFLAVGFQKLNRPSRAEINNWMSQLDKLRDGLLAHHEANNCRNGYDESDQLIWETELARLEKEYIAFYFHSTETESQKATFYKDIATSLAKSFVNHEIGLAQFYKKQPKESIHVSRNRTLRLARERMKNLKSHLEVLLSKNSESFPCDAIMIAPFTEVIEVSSPSEGFRLYQMVSQSVSVKTLIESFRIRLKSDLGSLHGAYNTVETLDELSVGELSTIVESVSKGQPRKE